MRNKESYDQNVQEVEGQEGCVHVLGIKKSSLLNDCVYFHVLSNFSLDLMHDILEGVVQYEIKLVLRYFSCEIHPSLFTLENLNRRVASHSFGFTDRKNKPSYIKLNSTSNDIGQKAMQAWCFIRHLPFIIGHDIKDDDPYWELLLKLLDCMDIIFSPRITPGLIAQLRILIEDHHNHFRSTFPDKKLLPKHHFMVHYPTCLENIGPLLHVWCMRYEAKHEYFCRVADTARNFKNICKTVAKQHQMTQIYQLKSDQPLENLEVGPGLSILCSYLEEICVETVVETIPGVTRFTEIFSANWVNLCGTIYQPLLLLCYDVKELPMFGQIQHILIYQENVYFVLQVWETLNYNSHYHAFSIKTKHPLCYVVKSQGELVDHYPLDVVSSLLKSAHVQYVAPRHVLFK
ncbi:uncharacterized protein LOC117104479 [Anneissia japonica]|uniref:uncharacterized protein LOC117104479 n=1 Tax=Anneissia japonica TaxID=1529436 RepID=UPI00142574EF|nr:uncharacterized protein LOC117104479 [Anneissia japonica]